jgi:hypothetical protein
MRRPAGRPRASTMYHWPLEAAGRINRAVELSTVRDQAADALSVEATNLNTSLCRSGTFLLWIVQARWQYIHAAHVSHLPCKLAQPSLHAVRVSTPHDRLAFLRYLVKYLAGRDAIFDR